jgi:hypothetical protein
LSAAHGIVQHFHDADPLTRMLQTLSALRQSMDKPFAR